ncbi:digalactosyl diacylglycerol deficient 2 [Perilla frutescens var. hirtella]|uniref:Digalactosyldiacylglycerol synthase 2, chloroplastic n=1 Tax=Perilla frutescens var. hirtella TaxID=608512 RepID=A0AAD4PGF0_PERFH|nr:digalactosyl diacylglycerol deficient 2 [Perilla frutescens var. hirtella]KAH6817877.1 digalactosyl diacylglycerol deficient 2 [Perilla frutescens var. frutescens]KAH6838017.1 digalactosyl diacylglycerol deficient 2 [Perilla frutescens var. hirtella]
MDKKQHIAIFTTASLPWLTGTSVNPLFRAAYLAKDDERKVTLVIPWLKLEDQHHVYSNKITFNSTSEQETYVRQWLEERTGFSSSFTIRFYPGRFSVHKRSIIALGDITEVIPDEEADVAVLEEPEHLTWYHHGKRWKLKFRLVVGVVHTNYIEYVKREKNGQFQAFLLRYVNSWVVNIYCHRVIRLSAATQELPRSVICNVHGVNPRFLEIGMKKREQQQSDTQPFTKGAYYIGKMVWHKGYKELLKLLCDNQKELTGLEVDLYGSGEDSDQVKDAAKNLEITVRVNPGRDHADPLFHDYKVFLNPSTTDVVCTTTAEALAMGKIVVCANHPSNDFFKQFPNCRVYDDSEGFVKETCKALQDQPDPLTDAQRHELSWEAATERFLTSAQLDNTIKKLVKKPSKLYISTSFNLKNNLEDASALLHYVGTGIVSKEPDEELSNQVGLSVPSMKKSYPSRKWAF